MRIRLFCLVILVGAGASFLIPSYGRAETINSVSVTATVLEQITYVNTGKEITIITNREEGAIISSDYYSFRGKGIKLSNAKLLGDQKLFIVAGF